MTTAPRRPTRPASAPPARRRLNKAEFINDLTTFVTTKAHVEELTKVYEGDKSSSEPSLKARLLARVKEFGKPDEKGSRYIYLADLGVDPIEVPGKAPIRVVKAEASGGGKRLNTERAEEFLTKRDLIETVDKYQYSLTLTKDQANLLSKFLGDNDLAATVSVSSNVLDEDEIAALRWKDAITEDELQALYDDVEPNFAFKPLAK